MLREASAAARARGTHLPVRRALLVASAVHPRGPAHVTRESDLEAGRAFIFCVLYPVTLRYLPLNRVYLWDSTYGISPRHNAVHCVTTEHCRVCVCTCVVSKAVNHRTHTTLRVTHMPTCVISLLTHIATHRFMNMLRAHAQTK